MEDSGSITVSASDETKAILRRLKEEGVINEMLDGYRLGVAIAHAHRLPISEVQKTSTFVNVGSLDKDGTMRNLIVELYPEHAAKPYALIEQLAEAGVAELGRRHENGQLRLGELYRSLAQG